MFNFYQRNDLTFGTIILSLLMGTVFLFLGVEFKKQKTQSNDEYRKWFRLHDRIRNSAISARGFHTIPPPPPMSQSKRKEFKLLRGYDKNR